MTRPAIALLTLCLAASAETYNWSEPRTTSPGSRTVWRASAIALLLATAADAHSSYGRHEANPLLRSRDGRFDNRGIALKGLITGGALGAQWLLFRKHEGAVKVAAISNFAAAATLSSVAIRNHVSSPAPALAIRR